MGGMVDRPRARAGFGRNRSRWVRTAALMLFMALAGTVLVAVTLGLFASLRVAYTTTTEHFATVVASNEPPVGHPSLTLAKGSASETRTSETFAQPPADIAPLATVPPQTPASPAPQSALPEGPTATVDTMGHSESVAVSAAAPVSAVDAPASDPVPPAPQPTAFHDMAGEGSSSPFPLDLVGVVVDSGLTQGDPAVPAGPPVSLLAAGGEPQPNEKAPESVLAVPAEPTPEELVQSGSAMPAADPVPGGEAAAALGDDQTGSISSEGGAAVAPVVVAPPPVAALNDAFPGTGATHSIEASQTALPREEAALAPAAGSEISDPKGATSASTLPGDGMATAEADAASSQPNKPHAGRGFRGRPKRPAHSAVHPQQRPQHRHSIRTGKSPHRTAITNTGQPVSRAAQFSPFPAISNGAGQYQYWQSPGGQVRPRN